MNNPEVITLKTVSIWAHHWCSQSLNCWQAACTQRPLKQNPQNTNEISSDKNTMKCEKTDITLTWWKTKQSIYVSKTDKNYKSLIIKSIQKGELASKSSVCWFRTNGLRKLKSPKCSKEEFNAEYLKREHLNIFHLNMLYNRTINLLR